MGPQSSVGRCVRIISLSVAARDCQHRTDIGRRDAHILHEGLRLAPRESRYPFKRDINFMDILENRDRKMDIYIYIYVFYGYGKMDMFLMYIYFMDIEN